MTASRTISVVIRTLNEERHLGDLLKGISQQANSCVDEIIIVDSGSTDNTVSIANKFGCKVLLIDRSEFTFGRSLNIGCAAANGATLVFISGHCIPCDNNWLSNLTSPIHNGVGDYSYGRQIGGQDSRFSERQLFRKYFPEISALPQSGFFCNNANAALNRATWTEYKFDEALTGLEDLELAKRLVNAGRKIAYVAEAPVHHFHYEDWSRIKMRYEREALALRHIMPEVHVSLLDAIRYFSSAVLLDSGVAFKEKSMLKKIPEVVLFRLMQFWGVYRGNHEHRKISTAMKEKYFYPR